MTKITDRIFCRNKLKIHRDRAASYHSHDFLFDYAADIIADTFSYFDQNANILEIGARRGNLTKYIKEYFTGLTITTDLSHKLLQQSTAQHKIVIDEEQLCFAPQTFDVVFASLNIHWLNNLPLFLQQIKTILKPNGSFVGSLIGGKSLQSLRHNFIAAEMSVGSQHFNRFSPLIQHLTMTQLLQKLHFKDIVTTQEIVSVDYDNLNDLLNDLRYMGESAAFATNHNYPMTKSLLTNLLNLYPVAFSEQFEIITFRVKI